MKSNKIKTTRLFSLFIIGLLMISIIPLTFAEENNAQIGMQIGVETNSDITRTTHITTTEQVNNTNDETNNQSTNNENNYNNEQRQRINKIMTTRIKEKARDIMEKNIKKNNDLIRKEVKKKVKNLIKQEENHKETLKEKIVNAHNRYKLMKEKYEKEKNKFEEVKIKYNKAKEKIDFARQQIKKCKGEESSECEQSIKNIKTHAKDYLLGTANKVLDKLYDLANRIESSNLENKDEKLNEINDKITEIENAKIVISNLRENASKEDIINASKTIRKAWEDTKIVMKKNMGIVVNNKIKNIINQFEKINDKLIRMIDQLSEKGYDTSSVQELKDNFNTHLDNAKSDYEKAKELYQENKTPGEMDDLVKKANVYVKDAYSELKLAREDLRKILKNIRATDNGNKEKNSNNTINNTGSTNTTTNINTTITENTTGNTTTENNKTVTTNVTGESE